MVTTFVLTCGTGDGSAAGVLDGVGAGVGVGFVLGTFLRDIFRWPFAVAIYFGDCVGGMLVGNHVVAVMQARLGGLGFAPFLVCSGKFCFEFLPELAIGWDALPFLGVISKEASILNKGEGAVCELDGRDGCVYVGGIGYPIFDLFEKVLDREVSVVRCLHLVVVGLKVCCADVCVCCVEVV